MSVTSDEEQSIQPEVSNSPSISEEAKLEDEDSNQKKNPKSQKKFQELVKKEKKRGVCYLSRVPPHMKPLKLRHLLEPYGEILRIYLAPEGALRTVCCLILSCIIVLKVLFLTST